MGETFTLVIVQCLENHSPVPCMVSGTDHFSAAIGQEVGGEMFSLTNGGSVK